MTNSHHANVHNHKEIVLGTLHRPTSSDKCSGSELPLINSYRKIKVADTDTQHFCEITGVGCPPPSS
jgi:hypothetical protein